MVAIVITATDSALKWTEGTADSVPAYGFLYNHSHSGITQSIPVFNVAYNISIFEIGDLNNINQSDGFYTITQEGAYEIGWQGSFQDGANSEFYIDVYVNDADVDKCDGHRKLGTGGDVGSFSGTCILNLSVGDIVNLRMTDLTNPVSDAVFKAIQFRIVLLDGVSERIILENISTTTIVNNQTIQNISNNFYTRSWHFAEFGTDTFGVETFDSNTQWNKDKGAAINDGYTSFTGVFNNTYGANAIIDEAYSILAIVCVAEPEAQPEFGSVVVLGLPFKKYIAVADAVQIFNPTNASIHVRMRLANNVSSLELNNVSFFINDYDNLSNRVGRSITLNDQWQWFTWQGNIASWGSTMRWGVSISVCQQQLGRFDLPINSVVTIHLEQFAVDLWA